MTWRAVVDAWVADITGNVDGMADVVVHPYAPWSLELLYVERNERHLAVWPEPDAEATTPFTTDGGQMTEQDYVVVVWEDAGPESSRLIDDDAANGDWLDLAEAIRARFFVAANVRIGDPLIMRTRYMSGTFPAVANLRVMELRFRVQRPLTP